ncbi:hypothetical protein [Acidipropionibacterium timonense]|uniref:hypothetical protein n=1 Tax=Acidipropionibacterium timonense TaxID=2161818 RepID=UPI00103103E0|nr:hypothetical protein [Acidipropionibacterium timonense]
MSQYQQPYRPGPQPWPSQPWPPQPQRPPKDHGRLSCYLAIAALVLSVVLDIVAVLAVQAIARILPAAHGTTAPRFPASTTGLPPEYRGKVYTFIAAIAGQLVPTGLGITALVLAAVTLSRPVPSKNWAIAGLVVSLCAPILSYLVFAVLMSTAIPA